MTDAILKTTTNNMRFEPVILKPSVQEYFSCYDKHLRLLNDDRRLDAFKKAINETVKEGDIVLDIGAGTGILSQFALEAGAKRIYLIEENANILSYAKERMITLNLVDKCIFIPKRSTNITVKEIGEKADVIISETIGTMGINEGLVSTIFDSKRFLKDNGKIIPYKLYIYYSDLGTRLEMPFDEPSVIWHNIGNINDSVDILLTKIYLGNITNVNINKSIKTSFSDGYICIWFRAKLSDNIDADNSPHKPFTSWGNMMIPYSKSECNEIDINISQLNAKTLKLRFIKRNCIYRSLNYAQIIYP